jgi:hypothetical protein
MEPLLERAGDIAYFTDADGARYRVHDVYYHEHKKHLVPLQNLGANTRYFVGEGRETRVYPFKKLESRVLTPECLAQQLSGVGFIALTPRAREAKRSS